MIIFATLLWDANDQSFNFSRIYDETWVEKLYHGVDRHYDGEFEFRLWTDRVRALDRGKIVQRKIASPKPVYGDCVQPYEASDEAPMILFGLDTMITGDLTPLVEYAKTAEVLALPRDPYAPHQACNGVALIPQWHGFVWTEWRKREGDMERCRAVEHVFIDDLFPGQVVSWKGHVREHGLGDARIVYFHGSDKPHELRRDPIVREHWR